MVSVLGAVRSKADITGKFPFCTNIDDTDKDDPAGYGSFWITQVRPRKYLRLSLQGACDHPTITGHYGFKAKGRDAYSDWVKE
jgi:hypothetical protein